MGKEGKKEDNKERKDLGNWKRRGDERKKDNEWEKDKIGMVCKRKKDVWRIWRNDYEEGKGMEF